MLNQRLFFNILVSCIVLVHYLHPVYSVDEKYAVIFDAGSTGSRVHVFRFDSKLDLVQIGKDFEYYEAIKPGLSSYAADPKAAAKSLKSLLDNAEAIIPSDLRAATPLKLGATAGLRLLHGNASEEILKAVRALFESESSLNYKGDWVNVLEGSQEAAYLWVAINYLLGKTGKPYPETVATVDLGGGSAQMTYAVPKPSNISNGNEAYVQQMYLQGRAYNLYAHSYLNYGLLAGRAEVLKVSENSSSPCIPYGYQGYYTYNGEVYRASSLPSGSGYKKCLASVLKALNVTAPCNYKSCTFNGIWNGGGGAGQKNLYVASFFYDKAAQVGFIDPKAPSSPSRPVDFQIAAKQACGTSYKRIISKYPNVLDNYMVCLDLVYQYALLVNGFGLHPYQSITLVNQIEYKKSLIEAAWPLGSAINAVSSFKFTASDI